MSNTIEYGNPPIKEAVISIKFESKLASFDLMNELIEELSEEYDFGEPEAVSTRTVNIKFDKSSESTLEDGLEHVGVKCVSEKKGLILQLRLDEFIISKLSNYTNWFDFKATARDLWERYLGKLLKVKYTRLGLRYINELSLPIIDQRVELKDYLTNEPVTPNGMPDGVSNFLSRVEVPYVDLRAKAVILQALKRAQEDTIEIILDFDVFSTALQTEHIENDELWSFFDELRNIKNCAFNGSLTDKAKEMFK